MPPESAAVDSPSTGTTQQDVNADSSSADYTGVTPSTDSPTEEEHRGAEAQSDDEESYQDGLRAAIRDAVKDTDEEDSDSKSDEAGDTSDDSEEEAPEGESSEKTADTAEAKDESEQEGQEVSDENLPFGKHPRWKQVLSERNEYREQAQQYEAKAKELDQITGFMQENKLNAEEVARGFRIQALLKTDPMQARDELKAIVRQLDEFAGEVLPDDIQAAVDRGEISEEYARQLAHSQQVQRYQAEQAQRSQQQTAQEREAAQRERLQREHAERVTQLRDAVTTWEQAKLSSDPDYERLQGLVVKNLQLMALEAPPETPEQARALAEKAYSEAKAQARKFVPKRQTVNPPVNSAHSGSTASAEPEPASMLEAVRQGLRQSN